MHLCGSPNKTEPLILALVRAPPRGSRVMRSWCSLELLPPSQSDASGARYVGAPPFVSLSDLVDLDYVFHQPFHNARALQGILMLMSLIPIAQTIYTGTQVAKDLCAMVCIPEIPLNISLGNICSCIHT